MIDRGHALPLVAQARQLGISRGTIGAGLADAPLADLLDVEIGAAIFA